MADIANQKVALITGANRGIGFETARELAELGYLVLLGARDPKLGSAAADKLKAKGFAADFIQLEMTQADDWQGVFDYIDKRFGKLDVLVNNAAVTFKEDATTGVSLDALRNLMEINFFSVVGLTQKLLPLLKKSPAARIVNVSSVMGSLSMTSDPDCWIHNFKNFAYGVSKAALNSFTIHLAHELRDTNIKVNSADPGWVKTDMSDENAPTPLSEGGKTSLRLATLADDGPTGGFFRLDQAFTW